MERLTYREKDGSAWLTGKDGNVWEKLAVYEDTGLTPEEIIEVSDACKEVLPYIDHMKELLHAEERVLLVRLPCKVGDTVYRIWKAYGRKSEITEHYMSDLLHIVQWLDKFGKTVFLTREEAEAALDKED